MKTRMEHLIEENGEHRKFRRLPDMRSDSPCQLGALVSKVFSERIINAPNLLVDVHLARLDHCKIDKMVSLFVSNRFMERVR